MYATDQLLDEVAYIASVFHWSMDEILDLEHPDRRHFVAAVQRLIGED
ncbi:MAG TPA: DUF6760 family protein [Pilimelia sp.]|nr:DUF6760 family protein [Pilimelia sp.]